MPSKTSERLNERVIIISPTNRRPTEITRATAIALAEHKRDQDKPPQNEIEKIQEEINLDCWLHG